MLVYVHLLPSVLLSLNCISDLHQKALTTDWHLVPSCTGHSYLRLRPDYEPGNVVSWQWQSSGSIPTSSLAKTYDACPSMPAQGLSTNEHWNDHVCHRRSSLPQPDLRIRSSQSSSTARLPNGSCRGDTSRGHVSFVDTNFTHVCNARSESIPRLTSSDNDDKLETHLMIRLDARHSNLNYNFKHRMSETRFNYWLSDTKVRVYLHAEPSVLFVDFIAGKSNLPSKACPQLISRRDQRYRATSCPLENKVRRSVVIRTNMVLPRIRGRHIPSDLHVQGVRSGMPRSPPRAMIDPSPMTPASEQKQARARSTYPQVPFNLTSLRCCAIGLDPSRYIRGQACVYSWCEDEVC